MMPALAPPPADESGHIGRQEGQELPRVFSIGHSTRPLSELVEILHAAGVRTLVDVRTVPKSRTNPQFNRDKLQEELPRDWGLGYEWMGKALGGLRKVNKGSILNMGWDNDSFRGYADYMQTDAFNQGIKQLLDLACQRGPVALMCAEIVHFQCHRRLLSDALAARGITVQHLTKLGTASMPHKVTDFAKMDGTSVTYPAYPHKPKEKMKKGPMDAFLHKGGRCGMKRKGGSGVGGAAPEVTAGEPGGGCSSEAGDRNEQETKNSPRKSQCRAQNTDAVAAVAGSSLRRSPRKHAGSKVAGAVQMAEVKVADR